jgi:hypothetical protein
MPTLSHTVRQLAFNSLSKNELRLVQANLFHQWVTLTARTPMIRELKLLKDRFGSTAMLASHTLANIAKQEKKLHSPGEYSSCHRKLPS